LAESNAGIDQMAIAVLDPMIAAAQPDAAQSNQQAADAKSVRQ